MRMGRAWLPVAAWVAGATGAAVVGLAAVSAVRDYVADAPVQALSVEEIERLLGQPSSTFEPIATVAAAPAPPSPRATRRSSTSGQVRANADDRAYGRDSAGVSAQGTGAGPVAVPETPRATPVEGTTGSTGSTGHTGRVSASTDGPTGASGREGADSGLPDPTVPDPTVPDPTVAEPTGSAAPTEVGLGPDAPDATAPDVSMP